MSDVWVDATPHRSADPLFYLSMTFADGSRIDSDPYSEWFALYLENLIAHGLPWADTGQHPKTLMVHPYVGPVQ